MEGIVVFLLRLSFGGGLGWLIAVSVLGLF